VHDPLYPLTLGLPSKGRTTLVRTLASLSANPVQSVRSLRADTMLSDAQTQVAITALAATGLVLRCRPDPDWLEPTSGVGHATPLQILSVDSDTTDLLVGLK
jgi:hypothetical protein